MNKYFAKVCIEGYFYDIEAEDEKEAKEIALERARNLDMESFSYYDAGLVSVDKYKSRDGRKRVPEDMQEDLRKGIEDLREDEEWD